MAIDAIVGFSRNVDQSLFKLLKNGDLIKVQIVRVVGADSYLVRIAGSLIEIKSSLILKPDSVFNAVVSKDNNVILLKLQNETLFYSLKANNDRNSDVGIFLRHFFLPIKKENSERYSIKFKDCKDDLEKFLTVFLSERGIEEGVNYCHYMKSIVRRASGNEENRDAIPELYLPQASKNGSFLAFSNHLATLPMHWIIVPFSSSSGISGVIKLQLRMTDHKIMSWIVSFPEIIDGDDLHFIFFPNKDVMNLKIATNSYMIKSILDKKVGDLHLPNITGISVDMVHDFNDFFIDNEANLEFDIMV